jgi:hypothetical protein
MLKVMAVGWISSKVQGLSLYFSTFFFFFTSVFKRFFIASVIGTLKAS